MTHGGLGMSLILMKIANQLRFRDQFSIVTRCLNNNHKLRHSLFQRDKALMLWLMQLDSLHTSDLREQMILALCIMGIQWEEILQFPKVQHSQLQFITHKREEI